MMSVGAMVLGLAATPDQSEEIADAGGHRERRDRPLFQFIAELLDCVAPDQSRFLGDGTGSILRALADQIADALQRLRDELADVVGRARAFFLRRAVQPVQA